ncbi:MAG: hypothetical protein JJ850_08350 [Kordiimonadaceae bacterium]|nr:hypothetical protein [Kordiimonadaceae bacterium]MBO6569138.1 hypothetical protein [Kordiimonadaceae bacterium]MBO6964614.1 hypothetical protein [Kordiimonadaceae bacterium]
MNALLTIAAALNFVASLLHLLIIYFGASWYRFFGAGERMASMAEQGQLKPTIITLVIASALSMFGLYALAGAGAKIPLPFIKPILVLITSVYLLRSLALLPFLRPAVQSPSPAFWTWSSLIVLVFGLVHLGGLVQRWGEL